MIDKTTINTRLREAEWLAGASVAGDVEKLVEHDFDVKEEWITGERTLDSVLLSRMVDENSESYKLEDQLLERYQCEPWKEETEKLLREAGDMAQVPRALRSKRCRLDAWAGRINARDFLLEYRSGGVSDPVSDVGAASESLRRVKLSAFTHRVASTISRLALAGMGVDGTRLTDLGSDLYSSLVQYRDQLTKAAVGAGLTDFSPTNDGHIRTLLFEKLGLEPVEYTKKEKLPKVDKQSLYQLDHPVVVILLRYNQAEKLYSTNIEGLRPFLFPVGSLPGSPTITPLYLLPVHLNPLGARTGRRSSSDPNTQNWNKRIRGIVRSRHPDGRIGAFDYEKLEPRILGWYAKEPFLLECFGPKGGGYIDIARRMWGFTPENGSPEYRATKSIVLGVHYDMQTPKMAWQLWCLKDEKANSFPLRFSADYQEHEAQVDELRDKYLRLIPRVVEWINEREEEVLRNQTIVTASGRVRHLPCSEGRRTPGWNHIQNQAINIPVQSLAADITGAALIDIEAEILACHGVSYSEYLRLLIESRKKLLTLGAEGGILTKELAAELYPLSIPINEVHDEITADLHPDHIKRDTEIFVETMRAVPTFRELVPDFDAPLSASPTVTRYWAQKE